MKLITMHKSDASHEEGKPIPAEVMQRINDFMKEAMQSQVFVYGEGLQPSKHRLRLRCQNGVVTTQKGPFAGENELPATFWIVKTNTMEEATNWATRFAKIVGDAEIEIGPLVEPWDLGFMPKPQEAPLRSMFTYKADPAYERGESLSPSVRKKLASLQEEMTQAKVLISAIDLKPSRSGLRLRFGEGKKTIIDGPFAESKELIAGFSILELNSLEDAAYWSERFAQVFDASYQSFMEIDIRLL